MMQYPPFSKTLKAFIRPGLRSIELSGPSFLSEIGDEDGLPEYHSVDPQVIAKFVLFFQQVSDPLLDVYTLPDVLRLRNRRGGRLEVELYPGALQGSSTLVLALHAMSTDLSRQVRTRMNKLPPDIVRLELKMLHPGFTFPPYLLLDTKAIQEVMEGLKRLDARAFTFGERGATVYLTVRYANRTERFRLKPERYDQSAGRLLKIPPLPKPLWDLLDSDYKSKKSTAPDSGSG